MLYTYIIQTGQEVGRIGLGTILQLEGLACGVVTHKESFEQGKEGWFETLVPEVKLLLSPSSARMGCLGCVGAGIHTMAFPYGF